MKRFQTEYSENSITYWPAYEVGKIGLIYFIVLGILLLTTFIWILLDNPSRETQLFALVALPIVVFVLLVVFRYTYRTMYKKIVVSNTGIEYFKNNVAAKKQIRWEDIEAVYFSQDPWYGRKSYRIIFKKEISQSPRKGDKCDFAIPVDAIDEQKLLQFIPRHLREKKTGDGSLS